MLIELNNLETRQNGFTMMEVLVAILVLSIGLLGLAGLQIAGLRNNQSAYYRSVATYQAWDMADRLRANLPGVTTGNYDDVNGIPADPGCIAAGCNTADLATYDVSSWNTENGAVLPGGSGTVCRDNDLTTAACEVGGTVFAIRVTWTDDRTRIAEADAGQQSFLLAVTP